MNTVNRLSERHNCLAIRDKNKTVQPKVNPAVLYSDNKTHREHGSENDTSIHPLAASNRAGIKLHRMSIKSLQRKEGKEEEKADVKSES